MQYKCQYCGEKDDVKLMCVAESAGKRNKYVHKKCYDKYMQKKEQKVKNEIAKDGFYNYVSRLYNIKILPKIYYIRITKLLVDYDYSIIQQAYLQSENSILWARKNKNFSNSISKELNYGLAIISDKLDGIKKKKNKIKTKDTVDKNLDVIYNKKEQNNDISDFL